MAGIQKVIGLMSGTSLDGVDAALIETDGEAQVRPGPSLSIPYDSGMRALLREALETARGFTRGARVPAAIVEAERRLTEIHARAVNGLVQKTGPADLVGFHGQTILHRPEQRWTWQIGDGALLARLTGIDVVHDFRSNDVAAGGQGAPFMPLYHAALVRSASPAREAHGGGGGRSSACDAKAEGGEEKTALAEPVAVVNIGGVGNVTYIDGELVLAFDTGPGNALIDDWMLRHTGKPVDQGGAFAATGQVNQAALAAMLENPYFAKLPPKSLDRLDFGFEAVEGLPPADGAATLADFTAASIARAAEHFPASPATWIISGGGRHNEFLMERLRVRLKGNVLKAEGARWDGDALEAEGFAYLAMRSKRGLPLSLPTTTGVPTPLTGGVLHKA
ncbi:MAG TPA: anhydro-N-acetylmuramic acid kinase [Rhizomicrobium sp.]|nr:anhydro-N-acetylmuramic acid kinase [Rhizomicrobium sp.]